MDPQFQLRRLESENQRLKRAVEELSVLNDVAMAVTSTATLDVVVDLIVQKCVKHLAIEQGAVLLFDDQNDSSAPLRTMVRKVQSDYAGIPYRLGDQITGWMLKNQEPLMISDVSADKHFRLPDEAQNVKSLLCVPMRMKGRMVGVLAVFNKTGGEPFTESDQRLLTIIAAQSAHVIENARLYEEEQALVRIEQELQTARDIQRRLLPKASPDIPCYDIAGRSEAARRVGGDYFDFIATEGGPTAICLADVSGKGVTASLLMANTQATVRSQALSGGTLAEQLYRANRLLYNSTEDNKFVTMFYSVLDPTKHELLYSNAGHNPPALYRGDADPVLLEAGGPVLGVLPQFTFEQSALTFEIGDLLVIYTDGISEAMNSALDEYGEDRLHRFVRDHQDAPSAKLIDQIFDDVKLFCGEAPQTDDMSMIVMRRIA